MKTTRLFAMSFACLTTCLLPPGKNRGDKVDGGLTIDMNQFGLEGCTGVALAPDTSLYFMTGIHGTQAIAHFQVNYVTHEVQFRSLSPIDTDDIEDIEVVVPEL